MESVGDLWSHLAYVLDDTLDRFAHERENY